MGKTLAELKASPDTGTAQWTFAICVASKLVGDLKEADQRYFELEARLSAAQAEAERRREGDGPPGRLGTVSDVPELERQADEAAAASDAIRERMKEHEVELHFAHSETWSQWRAAHPARDEEDDRAGFILDTRYAAGLCNIDDLAADLANFITAYGDEPASEEWWEFVRANSGLGDRRQAASEVVQKHEQVTDLGKSRVVWRADRKTSSVSE